MTKTKPAAEVPLETPPADSAPPAWQSRVVGHGTEAPDQLLANPRNWRIHPKRQQDAVSEALDKVGWVQEVIVNKTTGHVVDGHLRVGLAISKGEPAIPVSYVELTIEEEALVLATLDPLTALAATDDGALKGLLGDLEGTLDLELGRLVSDLTKDTGSVATPSPTQEEIDQRQTELDGKYDGMARGNMLDVTCPACAHEFAVNKDELS